MAAGLTIAEADFETFIHAFDKAVVDISGKTEFAPIIETDGSLNPLYASADTAIELNNMVWGAGFPAPIFRDVFEIRSQRLLKDKHLKLQVARHNMVFDAIWFNHNEALPPSVELIYELSPNYGNGNVNLQCMVRHAIYSGKHSTDRGPL